MFTGQWPVGVDGLADGEQGELRIFGYVRQRWQQRSVKKSVVWCASEKIDIVQDQQGGFPSFSQGIDQLAEVRNIPVF